VRWFLSPVRGDCKAKVKGRKEGGREGGREGGNIFYKFRMKDILLN
jgi:hypothetical protein